MFTKTCEYGIRAVMFVAQKSRPGIKIGVKEIANGINAPEHFVAKVLQDLSRKGILQSVKGPNGGFYLDDRSRKYTIADVVRAIDGDQLFTRCGLGLKYCSARRPCPLHDEFMLIRNQMREMLERSTVGDFNDALTSGKICLKR